MQRKKCVVHFGKKVPEIRRFLLPLSRLQTIFGKTNELSGIPYPDEILVKKQLQYAQHMLVNFITWRNITDLSITESSDYWKTFLKYRNDGKFSNKSLGHINNLQTYNDAFLCKNTG